MKFAGIVFICVLGCAVVVGFNKTQQLENNTKASSQKQQTQKQLSELPKTPQQELSIAKKSSTEKLEKTGVTDLLLEENKNLVTKNVTKDSEKDSVVEMEQKKPEVKKKRFRAPVDYKVSVQLQSGSSLVGVVKRERSIEKKIRGVYVPAQTKTESGAGIRLWYVNNSTGFIFLPYSSIKNIEKLQVTSSLNERRKSLIKSSQNQTAKRQESKVPVKRTQKQSQQRRSFTNFYSSSSTGSGNTRRTNSSSSSNSTRGVLKKGSSSGGSC